jgi:ubiquinone biosynthesis protein UbiJ
MSKRTVPTPVFAVLNHLITSEKWAHNLLLRHENKVVSISLPFIEFALRIEDGYFDSASEEIEPSVHLDVSQDAIWAFVQEGKPAAMKFVKISGDVDFAADINRLATDLKWELEEDLAKFIGDAPSNMIVNESKKIFQQGKKAVQDLRQGIRDYVVNEKKVLLGHHDFEKFKADIRVLRDDCDRVEKMLNLLELQTNPKEKN